MNFDSTVRKAIEPARRLVTKPVIELRRLEAERVEVEQLAPVLDGGRFDLLHQRSADPAAAQRFVNPYLLQLASRSPPSRECASSKPFVVAPRIAGKAANRSKVGGALVVALQTLIDRRDIRARRIESSFHAKHGALPMARFRINLRASLCSSRRLIAIDSHLPQEERKNIGALLQLL